MEPYVTKANIKEKTQIWLKNISETNYHKMKLNISKACLLVIDMQNYFLQNNAPAFIRAGGAILPGIKNLILEFRKTNRPVIYTKHIHHPDCIDVGIMKWWWDKMCLENSEDSEIYNEIAPLLNEKVIYKHRYSAFYNTDLETILRCLKIEDLIISGVMTNLCCESTTRDAFFRDYKVFFLADCTATMSEEMHLASLLNISYGFGYVTTSSDLL